jgi:hypothetical protein
MRELYVMTTPYFGLPPGIAKALRARIEKSTGIRPNDPRIAKEQRDMVGNAILRKGTSDPETNNGLRGEGRFEELITEFLSQRKARLSPGDKRRWIEDIPPTGQR